MKNTLVFGGSGLVGQYLINEYSRGRNFIVLCRSRPAGKFKKWINFDLLENRKLSDVLESNINLDEIIYLSQSPDYRDFPESSEKIININFLRFFEILEYARLSSVKKVLYASSGGIYGQSNNSFVESDWLADRKNNWLGLKGGLNFYFKSKIMSEVLSQSYKEFFNITILRPFFIYGVGQQKTSLIQRLISSVQKEEAIYLNGQDGIIITPTHAFDVASAIIHCLDNDLNEVYNVAGKESLSLKNIAKTIGKALSKNPVFKIDINSPSYRVCADINKLTNTGWAPKIDFKTGSSKIILNRMF